MQLTNKDIQAYESMSVEELIEERTRLATELMTDVTLTAEKRVYWLDLMEVICDLIWEKMYA